MHLHLFEQKEFAEESIMPDETTMNMVNAAAEKNAVDFKSALEASMNERIASELRDKKLEITNSMFKEEFEYSKKTQVGIVNKKKKEASLDSNDLAKKGSSPAKG